MNARLAAIVAVAIVASGLGCAVRHSEPIEEPPVSVQRQVVVTSVVPGSQAESLGIVPGDVILSYNGKKVTTEWGLTLAIQKLGKRPSASLVVLRDGKQLNFTVKPGKLGVVVTTRSKINRLADARTIDGIAPLSWQTGEMCSWVASVRRVLAHLGEQYDYKYLMGISGCAFRIQFFQSWCPSSPDPTCGFRCDQMLFSALGRDYNYYLLAGKGHEEPDTLSRDQLAEKIVKSIDAGIPVVAIDIVKVPEWGIITGYQNHKKDFFCRSYFDHTEGYNIAEKFPWSILIIGKKGEALSGEEAVRRSIAIAEKMYRTERVGMYFCGPRAIREWILALKDQESFETLAPQDFQMRCLANSWIYQRFYSDRFTASDFLNDYAGAFGGMRPVVLQLAKLYHDEAAKLLQNESLVPSPYGPQPQPQWTPQLREDEAQVLEAVLEMELKAQELIEQIMQGCGIEALPDADALETE